MNMFGDAMIASRMAALFPGIKQETVLAAERWLHAHGYCDRGDFRATLASGAQVDMRAIVADFADLYLCELEHRVKTWQKLAEDAVARSLPTPAPALINGAGTGTVAGAVPVAVAELERRAALVNEREAMRLELQLELAQCRDLLRDGAAAAQSLVEWAPHADKGSSGYQRKERVLNWVDKVDNLLSQAAMAHTVPAEANHEASAAKTSEIERWPAGESEP